jgi:Tfp pilus assembly protein PilO
MKFNIWGKIALFICVGFAAIVIWYTFLFTPKRNYLKKIREKQKLIQTQYNQLLENYSLAMMGSAKKLEISRKCIDILDNLPFKEDIAPVLSRVIEIGQGKDIRIISINPHDVSFSKNKDTERKTQLEKIHLDITLEGSFLNMGQYLFDLINLPFFAGYSKIDIETSEKIYPETKAEITCILLFLNNAA